LIVFICNSLKQQQQHKTIELQAQGKKLPE